MTEITKPSILSGVMELLPEEQIIFEHILEIIRKHFERNAFYPLDTTVLEKAEVLLAKGGGETEKQIYRFEKGSNDIAMRFDLTVPLARYVAQNISAIDFPFRRYQIGKVYRGERKQKGRYREFYQCDVDIVGNEKLHYLNDAEIPAVMDAIFQELNLPKYAFYVNHRGVLNGLLNDLAITKKDETLRILDKRDKIGDEKMKGEWQEIGLSEEQIERLLQYARIEGDNDQVLATLEKLSQNTQFQESLEELKNVVKGMEVCGISRERIRINPSITRGLDYYTGTVYETFIQGHENIGSICSGGRYDNLASFYTTQKLPGVGMSIGLTRLYSTLVAEGLLPIPEIPYADIAVLCFPGAEFYALEIARKLREAGMKTLVQIESGKIGKKMQMLDKKKIPLAVIVGDNEINDQTVALKDMKTGEQNTIPLADLIPTVV